MVKQKSFGIALILYSVIAWLASATLVRERLELYKDSNHIASCDFGLFLSCSTIMKTDQAQLFGFPNPFIGLVGFAITGAIGVFFLMLSVMLPKWGVTAQQGANRIPRWFLLSLQTGVTVAMCLVGFFWYTSIMVVMTLCPWCLVVWTFVIPMFFHTTAWTMANGAFGERAGSWGSRFLEWVWVPVLATYLFIVASILVRFQEYIF